MSAQFLPLPHCCPLPPGPWCLSPEFAADIRLLFQPGTKTRGTQRTIRPRRGTERHYKDNKSAELSCTTTCWKLVSRGKPTSVSQSARLLSVQSSVTPFQRLIQVGRLQPNSDSQHTTHLKYTQRGKIFCLFCSLFFWWEEKIKKVSIWYL